MLVRKLLVVIGLSLAFAAATQAQKVEVSQEYYDTSVKAFKEVVALRSAVAALEVANRAKDETLSAKNEVIKAKDDLILLRDEQVEMYRRLKCDKTSFFFGLIKNTRCK